MWYIIGMIITATAILIANRNEQRTLGELILSITWPITALIVIIAVIESVAGKLKER